MRGVLVPSVHGETCYVRLPYSFFVFLTPDLDRFLRGLHVDNQVFYSNIGLPQQIGILSTPFLAPFSAVSQDYL